MSSPGPRESSSSPVSAEQRTASAPSVSHTDAIKFLEEMFPGVDRSVILFTLNEEGRILERAVDALTRMVNQSTSPAAKAKSTPAKSRSTTEINEQKAISPSHSSPSSAASSTVSPSRSSPFKPITPEELEALKAEQTLHRKALERAVNEGPLGASKALKNLEPARLEREKYYKAMGVPLPSMLSSLNRVASPNELAAASMGPNALKKLHLESENKDINEFYKRTGVVPLVQNSSLPLEAPSPEKLKKKDKKSSSKREDRFERELQEAILLSQGLELSKQSQIGDIALTPAEMEFIYGKQPNSQPANPDMAAIHAQAAQLEALRKEEKKAKKSKKDKDKDKSKKKKKEKKREDVPGSSDLTQALLLYDEGESSSEEDEQKNEQFAPPPVRHNQEASEVSQHGSSAAGIRENEIEFSVIPSRNQQQETQELA